VSRALALGCALLIGASVPAVAPGGAVASSPVPMASTSAPTVLPAFGALGANFNENLDQVGYRELRAARASWVRGFYAMPEADSVPPDQSPTLQALHHAHAKGYRTVLALKFPKAGTAFPAPGSAALAAELARLDRVLPQVLGTADIVTIGNEPFIESLPAERDHRLNEFYETVARHVINARERLCSRSCPTHLFMGALNRLDLPQNRTPAVERYLEFVRDTPQLEGVDLHPHVPEQGRIQAFLDYTLPRLRAEQTFLVTEFSLVWYWQQHLGDPAPAAFVAKYGYPSDTQVWQVIGDAVEHPFPAHVWDEFLSQCPWFESHRHFLTEEMERYRSTGRLAVATYSFVQIPSMTAGWSASKAPWLLNAVFAPLTVQPRGGGMANPGYAWLGEFRRLQSP
jgi:hypothetical protein